MFMWLTGLLFLFMVVYFVYDWLKRRPFVGELHRKAVFITGCDSGFGYALAKLLYTRGVPVFAGCLTEAGATKLKEETKNGLKTVLLDVTDTESVAKAVQYVKDHLPKDAELWGLVNNAGVLTSVAPTEFLTKSDYMKMLEVNFLGVVEMCRAFLPLLKRTRGRIVNMTSIAASYIAMKGFAPYGASKCATQSYSEVLRLEQTVWGVTVSTIKPGLFKTTLTSSQRINDEWEKKWNEASPEVREEYGEKCLETMKARFSQSLDDNPYFDLAPVVNSYEHALFSVHPRETYYPGPHAKILFILKLFAPGILNRFMNAQKDFIPEPVVLKKEHTACKKDN